MAGDVGGGESVRGGDVAEVEVGVGFREGFGEGAGFGVEEGWGLREAVEHEDAEGWGGRGCRGGVGVGGAGGHDVVVGD